MSEEQVQEEQAPEEAGLLDENGEPISTEDAIKKANGEEETTEETDDSIERPEWLPEKFKTPEDLAKSYGELEKTLRSKGKLPPEQYEFETTYNLPEEEINQFTDFAKETGLTNAQAESVMRFAKEVGYFDVPDPDKEFEKLGDEKDIVMNTLESYSSQKLLPAEQEALKGMVYTAEQARLAYKLIRASQRSDTNMPNGKTAQPSTAESKRELETKLRTMLSEPDIRSNREKQKEAEALAKKISSM